MLKTMCGTLVGLEAVDAFLTMWAVNSGLAVEANPLMAPIAGSWLLPLVKVLPAIFVAWLVTRLVGRWPQTRTLVTAGLILAVVFLYAVIMSNLLEIGR